MGEARRTTRAMREPLIREARAIVDLLGNGDYIGFADYLLTIILAECVRMGVISDAAVPESLTMLRDPEANQEDLEVEHCHVNGIALLCDIRDQDLLDLSCDLLSRLREEQRDRDKFAEDTAMDYLEKMIDGK